MTLLADQPGLFDLPKPGRKAARRPTHPPRPRRSKECQAEECAPACLVCGKPEGRGLCSPRCATVCSHVKQPDVVEVCLVTTRVTAVLITGAAMHGAPGRRLALVLCPFCGEPHAHAPTFGVRYRISGCGVPYVVHLPRPRLTAGGR